MRKEVAVVRKKIDSVNKELKPLGHTCQKKVKFNGIFLCWQWTMRVYWVFFFFGAIVASYEDLWQCMSQEREYKEALEAFNEKNKEKVQLITKLMEVSFKYFSCLDRKMQDLHFLILGSLSSQSALWLFYRMNSWWAKARSWGWRSWRSWVRA